VEEEEMPVFEENLNVSGTGAEHLRANEGHGADTQKSAARARPTSSRGEQDKGRTNLELFFDGNPTRQEFREGLLKKLEDVSMPELQRVARDSGLNPDLEKAALVQSIHRMYHCEESEDESEGHTESTREFSAEGQDNGEDSSAKTHNSDGYDSHEEGKDSDDLPFNTKAGTKGQFEGARTKVRLPPLCSRKKQLHCMAIRQLPRSGFVGVVIISQAAKSAATRCPVCQRAAATHEWINPCTDYSMRQVVLS